MPNTPVPPEGDELHVQTVTCPACGVPVAIGYPRCPKCKAAVPQAPRARRGSVGSVREQLMSGGTSVEPPAVPGGGASWLPWVVIGLLVIGVGVFFAIRSGSGTTSAPVTDDDDDDDTDDVEDDDTDEPAPPSRGTAAASRQADPMRDAVRALDDALRGARLWAKVSSSGSSLIVESSLCAQIEPALAELARDARAAGATRVECHAQHGELMFEQGL